MYIFFLKDIPTAFLPLGGVGGGGLGAHTHTHKKKDGVTAKCN